MKKDIYLFGHHLPRPSGVARLAADCLVNATAVCQLATRGVTGDDEFKECDPLPIVLPTLTPYGKINPYNIWFWRP